MSGYYPDGVTGNEPQIAGYPEGEFYVECYADDPYVVHTERAGDDIFDVLKKVSASGGMSIEELWQEVAVLKARWDREGYVAECQWEGRAEGSMFGTVFAWECPNCGTEQETDLDDGGPEADRW